MPRYIESVLMLSGYIIGVGMFAIPFSFGAAGFWLGALELAILAMVTLSIHLCYGEVVLHTNEHHRLPGYVRRYLGQRTSRIADASAFFGICGTLLAYILLGGIFLDGLVRGSMTGSNPIFWSMIFVGVGSIITFFPLKKKTIVTSVMTALLACLIVLLIGFLLPRFTGANVSGFHVSSAFVPYGVLLFALSGATVIPDVVTFFKGTRARTRRVIAIGSLIPAALYFFFALAVVGTTGKNVSPDAIAGLLPIAGRKMVVLGNMIGLLAVITSYIPLNRSFQAFLNLDMGLSRRLSWAGGSFLPLFLFFIGFQSFTSVISVVGGTTVAIDGGLILATYHMILHKRERSITAADTFRFGMLYAIMIAGIGYELYRFIAAYIV